MTSTVSPARARVRALALVVPLVVAAGLATASCTETARGLGQSCLKDQDCLSGVCSQLVCTAAPSLLDAEVTADTGPGDAAADAAEADAPAPPRDTGAADAKDSAPGADAAGDAAKDAADADADTGAGDASEDGGG